MTARRSYFWLSPALASSFKSREKRNRNDGELLSRLCIALCSHHIVLVVLGRFRHFENSQNVKMTITELRRRFDTSSLIWISRNPVVNVSGRTRLSLSNVSVFFPKRWCFLGLAPHFRCQNQLCKLRFALEKDRKGFGSLSGLLF
jgi:hypothetical protein